MPSDLRGGVSLVAFMAALAVPSVSAQAEDVSRREVSGADGRAGQANFLWPNRPATPGQPGPDISIVNEHTTSLEVTGTPSVKIGSTGGTGGAGDSLLTIDVDGERGGKGGNINVFQKGALGAKGNQSGNGAANLHVYSRGGRGGGGFYSMGKGGDGGTVDLVVEADIRTEGDRFASVWAQSLGGSSGTGGTIANYVSTLSGGDGGRVSVTIANGARVSAKGVGSPGLVVESLAGQGGDRGNTALSKPYTTEGGDGGAVIFVNRGEVAADGDFSAGVLLQSVGGRGGNQPTGAEGGQPGAKGGNGGRVEARNLGSVATNGKYSFGLLAQSLGGSGGRGGHGFFGGGDGGAAGAGGSVSVVNSGRVETWGEGSVALIAQSIGGGNALGALQTSQLVPPASAGGGSGGGAYIGAGGTGGTGGDGGTVEVANGGALVTRGENAFGLLAQSIGGGGGDDGSVSSGMLLVNIAVGGRGGGGGHGGDVHVRKAAQSEAVPGQESPSITTSGKSATGIMALSVGGGGGTGGSAAAKSAGPVASISVAVGGAGGEGGNGGKVTVENDSTIDTAGLAALGISAKSVGGGGGIGGNAHAYALAVAPPDLITLGVSVALGGSGGKGGKGGDVSIDNSARITTSGLAATAIEAMSVGGGGGSGGDSASTTDLLGAFVNVGVAVSIGGSGGDGGNGGSVTARNSGMIETMGDFSRGIVAMSIGGGGGKGGAATAAAAPGLSWNKATEAITQTGLPLADTFTANIAIGGKGGNGGSGAAVKVDNNGRIATMGGNAQGIFAQSVGGGGGDGSGGLASGSGQLAGKLAIGGSGGGGGHGGAVIVTNAQGAVIETFGDGSAAIFAQSIGGGGGIGGGFAGTTKTPIDFGDDPAKFVVEVADELLKAERVLSQLLGDKKEKDAYAFLDKNNPTQKKIGMAKDFLKVVKVLVDKDKSAVQRILEGGGMLAGGIALQVLKSKLKEAYRELALKPVVNLPQVDLSVSLGGSGGKGGHGGDLSMTNAGDVITHGAKSWGLFAQSVGGGGGAGGASMSTGNNKVNLDVTIGASGGDGGHGGHVEVTNSGNIATLGGGSFGVFAQSVGGGGGAGGASINANTISVSGGFRMGGNAGKRSDGGSVKVVNSGSISTQGREAHALVAQSIGGGGGVFVVGRVDPTTPLALARDHDELEAIELALALLEAFDLGQKGSVAAEAGGKIENASTMILPNPDLAASFGGNGGAGGSGGHVEVEHSGHISTTGLGAFGIFAQSIGGGGGFGADGGELGAIDYGGSLGGSGGVGGHGGDIQVTLGAGARISTTGDGANGIFAQTIGGGGGYGGVGVYKTVDGRVQAINDGAASGNGGNIRIEMKTAESRVAIHTQGERANGIFAQSIGGGGGTVFDINGHASPTPTDIASGTGRTRAKATGFAGIVTIDTRGEIIAEGTNSNAIHVQTGLQKTDGSIDASRPSGFVTIRHEGVLRGGSGNGAAIRIDGGLEGWIQIGGKSSVDAVSGTAILSSAGRVTVENFGTLAGDVRLSSGASLADHRFTNFRDATYRSAGAGIIDLGRGTFRNEGNFDVGGVGAISTATLTGSLEAGPSSRLLVDITSTPGSGQAKSDLLHVSGGAWLNGGIRVNVVGGLRPETFTILTSGGGIHSQSIIASDGHEWSPFFWSASHDGHALTMTPDAVFGIPEGMKMTPTEDAVRRTLQDAWANNDISDSGALIYGGFAGLDSARAYMAAIDSLSPEESLSAVSKKTQAARTSMKAALSCPAFSGTGMSMTETNCVWSRISGAHTTQSESVVAGGYDRDSITLRIGAQREIADGWYLGATAGYTWSRLSDTHGYSHTNGQAFDASVSLKHQSGPWLLGLVGQLGFGHFETDRTLAFGGTWWTTSGSSNVVTAAARFRASREFAFTDWYVRLYADFDLIYTHMPAHRETGSHVEFSFDAANDWNTAFSPHLEFGSRVDLDEQTWLRPYASLGMTFFAKEGMDIAGNLNLGSSDSGFTARSHSPDMLFNVEAGLQLYRTGRFELRTEYKGDFGKNYVSHEGSLRLSIPF